MIYPIKYLLYRFFKLWEFNSSHFIFKQTNCANKLNYISSKFCHHYFYFLYEFHNGIHQFNEIIEQLPIRLPCMSPTTILNYWIFIILYLLNINLNLLRIYYSSLIESLNFHCISKVKYFIHHSIVPHHLEQFRLIFNTFWEFRAYA